MADLIGVFPHNHSLANDAGVMGLGSRVLGAAMSRSGRHENISPTSVYLGESHATVANCAYQSDPRNRIFCSTSREAFETLRKTRCTPVTMRRPDEKKPKGRRESGRRLREACVRHVTRLMRCHRTGRSIANVVRLFCLVAAMRITACIPVLLVERGAAGVEREGRCIAVDGVVVKMGCRSG